MRIHRKVKSSRGTSDRTLTIVGTTGGVIMVGGIGWAASWYFAAGHPSAWRLLPAIGMFVIGLMVLIWAVRRPNPRKLILARFDALIIQGGELLFHGNSPVVDVRYRDWMARVTALLVNTFDPSVAESLIKDPPDRTLPNAVVLRFHQQLDRLTIIREQFMSGEIKARIKKDSWYSLQ